MSGKEQAARAVLTARRALDLLDAVLCRAEAAGLDTADAREALAYMELDIQTMERKDCV